MNARHRGTSEQQAQRKVGTEEQQQTQEEHQAQGNRGTGRTDEKHRITDFFE